MEEQVLDKNKMKTRGRTGKGGSKNNSRQNSPVKDGDAWKCEMCKYVFTDPSAKMLECQRCREHYCIKCLKKSESEYNILVDSDLMWFCANCREKVEKNIVVDVEIEARCNEIMLKFESRITKLENEMKSKCDHETVKELIREATDKNAEQNEGDDQKEEVVMSEVFSEINERKQRENNIVVYGLEEKESEKAEERNLYDQSQINSILKTCIGSVTGEERVKVRRLGKYNPDKPKRPLLATLSGMDTKRALFQNIKELKQADEHLKSVRISNDFTQKERAQEKKLFEEMRELQKQESGDFVYRIRGPPWGRRIVKMKK